MGLSVAECRSLLSLCSGRTRSSAQVKRIAAETIVEIDQELAGLTRCARFWPQWCPMLFGNPIGDHHIATDGAQDPDTVRMNLPQ